MTTDSWKMAQRELTLELKTLARQQGYDAGNKFRILDLVRWFFCSTHEGEPVAFTILGLIVVVGFCFAVPFAVLLDRLPGLEPREFASWTVLASISSMFSTSLILMGNFPKSAGWRLLMYPISDRIIVDYLRWWLPIVLAIHLATALVAVMLLGIELGWSIGAGILFAVLQAFFLTSLQLIAFRSFLPSYRFGSVGVAILFGSVIASVLVLWIVLEVLNQPLSSVIAILP